MRGAGDGTDERSPIGCWKHAGKLDPASETSKPEGATGTWTTITVLRTDGATTATEHVNATGKLAELYQVVAKFAGG